MIPTLQDAFNKGMEYFAKHCLRYGTIVDDISGTYYKGHWRDYLIDIQGERVRIHKENGNTTGAIILSQVF